MKSNIFLISLFVLGILAFANMTHAVGEQPTMVYSCKTINQSGYYLMAIGFGPEDDTCMKINASDVTLDGGGYRLIGKGEGYGVYAANVNNITIKNILSIETYLSGIHLENVNNFTIRSVNPDGNNLTGIDLMNVSNGLIENVTVINSRKFGPYNGGGIILRGSSNNLIVNTTVFNNSAVGIALTASSNNNVLSDNNVSINYNNIIIGSNSKNNSLYANKIAASNHYGLYTWYADGITARGNEYANNSFGIWASMSKAITIQDTFINNTVGLNISDSRDIDLAGSRIVNSRLYGISIAGNNSNILLEGLSLSNSLYYDLHIPSSIAFRIPLSLLSSMDRVYGASIFEGEYGSVAFLNGIDWRDGNWSSKFIIANGEITINESLENPITNSTNVSITFKGLPMWTNIRVLRNGEACPATTCIPEAITSNTSRSFTVNQSGMYKITGDAIPSPSNAGGSSGGGSSGGGGGSATPAIISCINVSWNCTEWSPCLNGTRSRTCHVSPERCLISETRPNETESCLIAPSNNTNVTTNETEQKNFFSAITGAITGAIGEKSAVIIIIVIVLLAAAWLAFKLKVTKMKSKN